MNVVTRIRSNALYEKQFRSSLKQRQLKGVQQKGFIWQQRQINLAKKKKQWLPMVRKAQETARMRQPQARRSRLDWLLDGRIWDEMPA